MHVSKTLCFGVSTSIRSIQSCKTRDLEKGRREGGGGAGRAKYLGPEWVWGPQNFDETSGHCAAVKRVGGP